MAFKEGCQSGFGKMHELSSPLTKGSLDWPFVLNLIKFWLSENNRRYAIGHEIGTLVGFIANSPRFIKKDMANLEAEFKLRTK